MKFIKYRLEFILVWLFDRMFWVAPASVAFGIGAALRSLARLFMAKRDRLIEDNLKRAFPDKSAREIRKIRDGVWQNISRTAVEFIRLPKMKDHVSQFVSYENERVVKEAEAEGKGVIFVTFHFSNWEMAGVGHQSRFGNLVAIARPMKNPLVEKWVQSKRRFGGMDIILHRQAVRQSLKLLRQKKSVAILVDQNLYHGGVFVPFFGRLAATTTLPALLHLRTKAPMVLGYSKRTPGGHVVCYEPIPRYADLDSSEDSAKKIMTEINQRVENIIRTEPQSWFWIHNRWKRSPEA